MEDLNTANTEGTASPSPTDVGATGASGVDAAQGQQTAEPSIAQGQTPPETGQEEFSAGWDFDAEAETPSAIPESDDDIESLTADPNLDQKQVPKLVEDLRGARAEARQNAKELKQYRETLAKLEEFGGIEGVTATMSVVNGLIRNPSEGAIPFLSELAEKATPAYWQVVDSLVEYEADNLIAKLQQAGKLPDGQQQQSAHVLTAEDWEKIPKELHDVARQVPVNQLIEWLDKGTDESLRFHLQTQKELAELKGTQREQAEQQWRTAVQQAETKGQQEVASLSSRYEQAHLAQMSKWQPFGPEGGKENQQLYRSILEGAHATLLSDNQFRSMFQDATAKLQAAPMRRLRNDHLGADADERDARGLAARYNTRLGQVMKEMITSLDSVFRDARAYRETQRQNVPNRTEISGQSTQTGRNGAPPTLLPNGKTNPAHLDYVIANLPGNGGRSG